ncbi:MAG: hypothetical protein PHQ81_05525 [Methanofollis sp.]|nr:hypothetical protein [Methanofollis sp.]
MRPASAPTLAGFNAALETAVGGHAVADPDRETYTCRLRCHDVSVRVSSYEDDAICDCDRDLGRLSRRPGLRERGRSPSLFSVKRS